MFTQLLGKYLVDENVITADEKEVMAEANSVVTRAIIIGVVVVLVLSASMSTLSSLVITSSSTITLDVIKGNIIKDMKEKSSEAFKKGLASKIEDSVKNFGKAKQNDVYVDLCSGSGVVAILFSCKNKIDKTITYIIA